MGDILVDSNVILDVATEDRQWFGWSSRHLEELADMVAAGRRAVMLFLIQIGSADRFTLAADIDRAYAAAFVRASAAGVEALAYRCAVSGEGIAVAGPVPIIPPEPAK